MGVCISRATSLYASTRLGVCLATRSRHHSHSASSWGREELLTKSVHGATTASSRGQRRWGGRRRTGIGRGYGLRVVVPEGVPDGRHDDQSDRGQGADDAGPEEGRALARRPAPVTDGLLPEEGRTAGHFGCCGRRVRGHHMAAVQSCVEITYSCSRFWGKEAVALCLLSSRAVSLYSCYSHRVKSERSGRLAKVPLANRDYVRFWRRKLPPLRMLHQDPCRCWRTSLL